MNDREKVLRADDVTALARKIIEDDKAARAAEMIPTPKERAWIKEFQRDGTVSMTRAWMLAREHKVTAKPKNKFYALWRALEEDGDE